jgi:urease accessory protein
MGTRRLTTFLLRTAVLPLWAAGHAMAHHLPPGMEEADEFAEPTFAAAVVHPFSGADHWLAALAVGLSAWSWGKKTGLQSTGLFVLAMAGGIVAGRAGFHLPMMETGLAVSVILGGCVVAGARWFSAQAVLALAALTGAWHGIAHGVEWPATASPLHASGLVLGSALIAFSAALLASWLPASASRPALPRWAGRGLAAAGAALLAVSFAS